MSSFGRQMLTAALALSLGATASAQLLPSIQLPPVNLPTGSVPVVGPVLEGVLGQPEAQQAINPTLDSVAGLPERIAESGERTLLQLRRLRLQQLIREKPGSAGGPWRSASRRRGRFRPYRRFACRSC